jgi:hypothetical protein
MMNCFIISTQLFLINLILNASRPDNHNHKVSAVAVAAGTGTLPYGRA